MRAGGEIMRFWVVLFLTFMGVAPLWGGDTLELFVVDTEGGKALIVVTPERESLLVDAGYPRNDERDTDRIVAAAEAAGVKRFDVIVATHYDLDHSGNVARVDARIPGQVFVDHGAPMAEAAASESLKSYVAAIGSRRRLSLKPGETLPLTGVRITVVSSAGAVLAQPLAGAGAPNRFCSAGVVDAKGAADESENAGSLGLLYEFGRFRMLDLADLLVRQERELVCPVDRVGTIDLFMVSHHGFKVSNSATLVHALRPRAAIMNNGPRKGGEVEVLDILRASPGLEDLWQMHSSPSAGGKNAPEALIANLQEDCGARLIRVSARRDGSFTVTNARNGFSKTYGSN
jgi:competence protein ComEC